MSYKLQEMVNLVVVLLVVSKLQYGEKSLEQLRKNLDQKRETVVNLEARIDAGLEAAKVAKVDYARAKHLLALAIKNAPPGVNSSLHPSVERARFVVEQKKGILLELQEVLAAGSSKKRNRENERTITIEEVDKPVRGGFLNVNGLYEAGLENRQEKSVKRMFCRDDSMRLLESLDQMDMGMLIMGPPGVGKSMTVWFWVCKQVKINGLSVLWVHVQEGGRTTILWLSKDISYANTQEYSPYETWFFF
jgi:hypothetical protein